MAVRNDFTAGEVLAAADLNDTFASKLDYPAGGNDGDLLAKDGTDAEWIAVPEAGLTLITAETFIGVSGVSINNCFTSDYQNYRFLVRVVGSTTINYEFRMRAAGSDNTATTYNTQTLIGNGSTVTAGRGSNQNIGRLFSGSTAESVASFDVMSPALANATGWLGVCMRAAGSTIELESRVTGHATTSAFDGFSFLANTGTMTGRLYVYGYANA
jgi:hypothetical protein